MKLNWSLFNTTNPLGHFEGIPIYESKKLGSGYAGGGLALPGKGIIVAKGAYSKNLDPWIVKHEFGHFLQALQVGKVNFYLKVGVSSILSASFHGKRGHVHQCHWTETWANYLSYHYFNCPADWPMDRFPIHPYHQPVKIIP